MLPVSWTFVKGLDGGHSPAIRPPLGRRASLVVVRWFSLLTVLRPFGRETRAFLSFARGLCGGLDSSSPAVCGGSERSLVRFRLGSRLASTNEREKRNQTIAPRRARWGSRAKLVPLSSKSIVSPIARGAAFWAPLRSKRAYFADYPAGRARRAAGLQRGTSRFGRWGI